MSPPCFDALNTNIEETGILLLPDFRIPTEYDDENEESKEISRMSGLNDILHSLSFIKKETLNDFRLNNVILDPERRFEQIRIAFTPTTKKDKAEMFQVGEKVALQDESGHNCVYLGDITLKNKDNITEHFKKCLHRSRQSKNDIFVGTEMFGTEALCETGESGVNLNLIDAENAESPFLIVTPTMWKNNSNVLSVFTSGGELIGRQYKQYPFAPKGKAKEHLINTPREILLVHIKGLGKAAFPICFDLLNSEYKNLLIHQLRTDFLICPSYSPTSMDFEIKLMEATSVGSYAFWFNSCSAIKKGVPDPAHIGLGVIPTQQPSESVIRIDCCGCQGDCGVCLFEITVPAKRTGRLGRVKNNVEIKRI